MKKEELEHELKAARERISELEANLKINEMESAPFRYAVEHSVDLIQSVRANGRFEFVNRAWLDALGYSSEDVKSLELKDVIHPDHWVRCDDAFKRIQKGEQIPFIQTVLIGRDQQQILVEGTASARSLGGKFHATYSVLRDVTRSRQAEELLRLSQEKLNDEIRRHTQELEQRVEERTRELERAYQELQSSAAEIEDLYNNAPCGYHSLNAEGQFVNVNDSLLSWLGYKREEVIGRHIKEFLVRDSWKIFDTYFPSLKIDGVSYDQEMDFVRKDGQVFSASLSASALRDEQGNFLRTRTALVHERFDKKGVTV